MVRRNISRMGRRALRDAALIEVLEDRLLLTGVVLPDLTAAIVSLDTTVARGHGINVDFQITNTGAAPTAQTWSDRIWISPDPTFDPATATDIGLWWNGDVGTLPLAAAPGPGNSYEVSRNATVPQGLATGTYYVFVEADRWNEVAEADETNNISPAAQVTVVAPDIAMTSATITNLSSPYNVTWGQAIDVNFTVTNNTAARLDGWWYDSVVASTDTTLDSYPANPSDWVLDYVGAAAAANPPEALAPHGSYTHTAEVRIDGPWALPAGPGYLLFVANNVDWSSPDADRSDNMIAIPITVRAPDLQVTTSGLDDKGTPITPASLVNTGTSVNVSWTVTNTGDASAVTPWSDSVFISKKDVYDNAAQWLGNFDPPAGTFPLAPSGTYSNSFAFDTTTYDGGQYYIFVKADSGWALAETSDDNNVSPAMPLQLVAPATSPDLTVDNLSIVPDVGNIGTDMLTISYDIHNIDPVNPTTADYWFDTVWLSSTPTFDRATAIWANTLFDNPPTIGPGGTYAFSTDMAFPTNVGLGTFYVFVEADAYNYQQESNGNNNLTTQNDVTVILNGPDFIPTTASIDNGSGDPNSTDVTIGSSFTVNWHVDNSGNSDTPADWIEAIYVSNLWYLDQTATKIGEFTAQSLGIATPVAAGDGYDASAVVTIPAWMGTGTKYLLIVSGLSSTGGGDGSSVQYQPDANIYNNTYSGLQVQVREADLAVTAASADVSTANVGDFVHVDWSVANNGDAGVDPGWVDRVYISRFPTFSEQTSQSLYWFATNFSMGGQGSSYGTGVDVDTSGLDGGDYYIFVVTDADHTVAETDETNNVSAAIPLTLTAAAGLPDLTASIDGVNPDPATGDIGVSSVDVTYTIHNDGSDPTDGNGWNDAVWLSPTSTFDPATAISLGSFWNNVSSPLDPTYSYTNTVTVYLPAGVGTGTFYLFIDADINNSQMESDGGNNLSPAAGAVPVVLNGPDLVVTGTTFNSYYWDPTNPQITLNNTFELDWTIANRGNADSSYDWADAIYVSDSPIWDPNSAALVTQFDAAGSLPLSPGDSYDSFQQVSLPGWVGPGIHFLYVVTGVDLGGGPAARPLISGGGPVNFVPDADFASNVSSAIQVDVSVPNVDLTVSIDDAPPTIAPGQYVTDQVQWTVTNNGADTANGNTNVSYNWTDTLYLTQTPDDPASYIFLASYDTSYYADTPLWGNSSYTESLSGFDIPYGIAPGAWYFVIVTDSNNDQGETSETNNVATIPVQIAAADLTTPQIDVTPVAGTIADTVLHISWTVQNDGVATASGGWEDVIYVSSSNVFDATAVLMDSVYHPDNLDPGNNYMASDDLTLPGGIGAGPHYIYVVADGYNYLPETDETNNASDGFPVTVSGPDLQVTASHIDSTNPAPAVVNGTVSVSWTVTDTGDTPTTATGWYDTVYISDNPTYGQGNQWYLGIAFIATGYLDTGTLPLAAGDSYSTHLNDLVIPGYVGAGARYIIVVTDNYYNYYYTQPETNEDNNAGTARPITLGAPDLAVTAASSDSSEATVGDSVTVHWTVANNDTIGTDPAVGRWYDAVYVSNDDILSPDDMSIFSRYSSDMTPDPTPLAAGTSYDNTATAMIPSSIGTGAKYLIFVTDAGGNEGEDDESNNTFAVPITLFAPDLVVSGLIAPTEAIVNGQITLTWTTQNIGQYPANGPWFDSVYISDDAVFDPNIDTWLGALHTSSLPAGVMPLQPAGSVDAGGHPTDRYTTTQSFTVPNTISPGPKYLFVGADQYYYYYYNNIQTETDETNNTRMASIDIVAPDLAVINPSVPASANPGDTIAVTWTTVNLGSVPAYGSSGTWYDAIYISDDATFGNADDRFLGYYAAGPGLPLQPAGSVDGVGNPTDRYTATVNVTIPADMSGGIKHIFIKADGGYYAYYTGSGWYEYAGNQQGETDETNNVAGLGITLGAGAPPVINGSDAVDDTLYLRRSADGSLIEAFLNSPTTGTPTWSYGLGASIAFNGLGGSDTLVLDFANGSPIPSGGLAYDGGDAIDSLLVTGTNSATALTVQPTTLDAGGAVVTYANTEQVALDGSPDSAVLLGSLTLSSNLAMVAGKNLTLRLSALSISAGSLDVADNNLMLDYAGAAPLADVRNWLDNGRMGAQPSIITSTASPGSFPTALGLVDNALLHLTSWEGQVLTAAANFGQLLIKHTYAGDTNLDGQVTQADFLNVIAGMGSSDSQWFMGDLNDDGMVTVDDLAMVTANMGAGTSGAFGPPLAVAAADSAAAPQAAAAAKSAPATRTAAKAAARKPTARKSHKLTKSIKARLALLARKLKHAAKPAKRHAS